jgi:hypothetical protein
VALDCIVEWRERRARVDEDGCATLLVGHEIGV